MQRWWRRLLAPPPPSAYLFRHLDRDGRGYAIDDLISGHSGDDRYQDVIDAVSELMMKHGDQALVTPIARTELRLLAMRLATRGR